MTDEERNIIIHIIARQIDMPSLYMSGPSFDSLRKAEKALDNLIMHGIKFEFEINE